MEGSKYSLLRLEHFRESCFEEDVPHCIVGRDPQKRWHVEFRNMELCKQYLVVCTSVVRGFHSRRKLTFSIELAAKSECKQVSKY